MCRSLLLHDHDKCRLGHSVLCLYARSPDQPHCCALINDMFGHHTPDRTVCLHKLSIIIIYIEFTLLKHQQITILVQHKIDTGCLCYGSGLSCLLRPPITNRSNDCTVNYLRLLHRKLYKCREIFVFVPVKALFIYLERLPSRPMNFL